MEPTTPVRHRRAERYQNPEPQEPVRRVPAEELQPAPQPVRRVPAQESQPAPAAVPGDRYHRAAPQGIAAPQSRATRREPQGQAASPASPPAQPWASQAPRPQFTQQPLEEPPETMDRHRLPPKPRKPGKRKLPNRMPLWLTVTLCVLVLVIGGLIAAESMMRAYITQRVQERAEAQQRVIEAYPMVYRDLIEQYAEANNLRPAYVAAIILNESSYRTDAESSVGARGLMQLMPDTAEWIAGKLDVENYSFAMMYDAETNLRFGTWYLGYLGKLFQGDPTLVACAFHAGQGEVRGWLSDPSLSEDGVTLKLENLADGPTKSYAGRVTRDYGIYQALYFTPPAQAAGVDPLPDADSALLPLASR